MLLAFTYVFVVRGLSTTSALGKTRQPSAAAEQSLGKACGKVMAAEKKSMPSRLWTGSCSASAWQTFSSGVAAGAQSQRDRGRAPAAALLAGGPGASWARCPGPWAGWSPGGHCGRCTPSPGRPAARRGEPGRAPRAGRAARRAEGTRRHLRRHAGPARRGLRQPAPLRRERLPRAAHPADRDADRHRRHAGQAGPDPRPARGHGRRGAGGRGPGGGARSRPC